MIEIIGFLAGIVTFSAQIPQCIKSARTKQTRDISLPLYVILWCGIALWIVYGYVNNVQAVFYMNLVLECLVSWMIFLKLKYGMRKI